MVQPNRAEHTARSEDEQLRHLDYWRRLTAIHRAYTQAAEEIIRSIGTPICIPNCGLCCTENSPLAFGLEAEYTSSWLLGAPQRIQDVLNRCRDWLTRKGDYTYGSKVTLELWKAKTPEWERILREPCPFLDDDKMCLIHHARPLVCRAWGVTHMPGRNCPRPLGNGEDAESRAWFDPHHPTIPLHKMVTELRAKLIEPRYIRQGFFIMMLFERFRAEELAGLMDDGKVPLLKMTVGWGGKGNLMLWQEDLERQWNPEAADASIAEQVPLRWRPDKPPIVSLDLGRMK